MAPVDRRPQLTIEACRAGMDVWVEAPVCLSMDDGMRMVDAARRYGRIVQAGTAMRSAASWQNARDIIRRGDLGRISFVRMTGARRVHLIDAVQFAFGEATPLSVAAQGGPGKIRLATFCYPGFVASWEEGACETVSFHGSHATLTVGREDSRACHWRNFIECVRSRRKPVSDIETAVRSTATDLAVLNSHSPWNLEAFQ
jgi:predicted dehydrogenase